MPKPECFFCAPELYADRTIAQNDVAIAFLSNPKALDVAVHTLIVPRRHIVLPTEISDEEALGMLQLGRFVQGVLLKEGWGIDMIIKTRPDGIENNVKQLHLHQHVVSVPPDTKRYGGLLDMTPGNFERLTAAERDRLLGIFASALS